VATILFNLRFARLNGHTVKHIAAKRRRARSNDYTYTYCDVFALGELKNSGLPVHPQFVSKNVQYCFVIPEMQINF
jgi:hypothetical protein